MGLNTDQKQQIITLLRNKIDTKLKKYARESSSMPFLLRLMQDKEKVASYSFVHSISTTLGMSIYEEVSKIVSIEKCEECERDYNIGGLISNDQKTVIDNIVRELRNQTKKCNIDEEIREILSADPRNGKVQKEGKKADFYMLRDGIEHYFEIKTVKPNIDVFTKSKTKLLEWVARRQKIIKVFLAFPYNPYYPKPYERFTLQGLLKPGEDLLIGEEYWSYISMDNIFEELLELFDIIGKEYKEKINNKIKEVGNSKMSF
jgi:hypothetical protein